MTLAEVGFQDEVKSRLNAAFGRHLAGVVLYGSHARGDASPDSDVDLLVLLDRPVDLGRDLDLIVRSLYPLQLKIDSPIHAVPVPACAFEAGEYAMLRRAKTEGVLL